MLYVNLIIIGGESIISWIYEIMIECEWNYLMLIKLEVIYLN